MAEVEHSVDEKSHRQALDPSTLPLIMSEPPPGLQPTDQAILVPQHDVGCTSLASDSITASTAVKSRQQSIVKQAAPKHSEEVVSASRSEDRRHDIPIRRSVTCAMKVAIEGTISCT